MGEGTFLEDTRKAILEETTTTFAERASTPNVPLQFFKRNAWREVYGPNVIRLANFQLPAPPTRDALLRFLRCSSAEDFLWVSPLILHTVVREIGNFPCRF